MRNWLLYPLMLVLLSSCSGKGGTLLSFFDEESKEDNYGTVVESEPNAINNLVSWFKTDDLISSSSTSNNISEWRSSLSNSGSLLVGSGKAAPSVVSWKTGKALNFTSSLQQGLEMQGFNLGSFEAFSIVMVVKVQSPGSLMYFGSDLYSKEDSGLITMGSGGKLQIQHVTTPTDYNTKATVLADWDQPHIIIATFAPSSDWRDNHIYVDGFRVASTTGESVGTPTPFVSLIRHLNIGPSTAGTNFSVAEVAIYGRQLTPRDAYSLSKGLGKKWQIPVQEKITKEIFEDKIDTGIKEITFETLKRDIFTTKGCLGCHNANMKADGIDLSSYAGVKTGVSTGTGRRVAIPGQATNSGLYTSVTGAVPQMPRLAASFGGYLTAAQTAEISVWINKGMKENENSAPLPLEGTGTDDDGSTTDPGLGFLAYDDVYYGVLNTKCINCHQPTKKSGGVDLSSYHAMRSAKNTANQALVVPGSPETSRLYQVVSGYGLTDNKPKMPASDIWLPESEQKLIKDWITQGALQNHMSITKGISGFTSATNATFEFEGHASGSTAIASYECSLDGGAYTACVSPKSYSSLSGQGHTFQVRFVDSAGGKSASSAASWTVDFLAPAAPTITSPPAALTKVISPAYSFTTTDNGVSGIASYQCKINSGNWETCTSRKTFSSTLVVGGNNTVSVRAVDFAGNTGDQSDYTWEVDNENPTVSFATSITGTKYVNTPMSIAWTASDTKALAATPITIEYSTNAGTSYTTIISNLTNADSPYTWTIPAAAVSTQFRIRVSATDSVGNVGRVNTSNLTVTTDSTAPVLSVTGAPTNSNSTSATFTFSATDTGGSGASGGITYTCKLDSNAEEACTSPKNYTGLSTGSHTVIIKAKDPAGNTSNPNSTTWTRTP